MTIENINDLFESDNIDVVRNLNYIYNNSPLTIWYQDPRFKIIWGNNNLFDLINSDLKTIKGDYCYRVLQQRDNPCPKCNIKKVLTTKTYQENNLEISNKTFRCRGYPVKNTSDKVVGVVLMCYDISENIHLEKKLETENFKTTFFSNISHDFKIPLQLIYSAFKLLDSNLNDKTKYKKYLDIIEQNYYRLVKMVNNIIDISKIKSGNYKLNFQNIDIVKLIKKTTISVSEHIKRENKTLIINTSPESKIIACSPFEIERIMLNLLSNTLKHTVAGDRIIINISENDSRINISVKDTGEGIPKHMHKKLFHRFSRDTSSNVEGSGMGLSIVRALVEMHKGEITYNSDYQEGSEFIISLPITMVEDNGRLVDNNFDYELAERINIEFSDLGVMD